MEYNYKEFTYPSSDGKSHIFACLYTVSRSSMDLGSLSFFYANAYQLM